MLVCESLPICLAVGTLVNVVVEVPIRVQPVSDPSAASLRAQIIVERFVESCWVFYWMTRLLTPVDRVNVLGVVFKLKLD